MNLCYDHISSLPIYACTAHLIYTQPTSGLPACDIFEHVDYRNSSHTEMVSVCTIDPPLQKSFWFAIGVNTSETWVWSLYLLHISARSFTACFTNWLKAKNLMLCKQATVGLMMQLKFSLFPAFFLKNLTFTFFLQGCNRMSWNERPNP